MAQTTKKQGRKKKVRREGSARAISVLIVDDHELMRYGLRLMVGNEPGLEVCGEAADEASGFAEARRCRPDVAIVDLALNKGDGVALIKRIKAAIPNVRIIVLTMHDERVYGERVLRAGAVGYVNKQSQAGTILKAICQVVDGQFFFSPEFAQRHLHHASDNQSRVQPSPMESLSDREFEVFRLIGQGLASRQIAERMDLSTRTVDTYRERLKAKLQLESTVELRHLAVHWALEPTAASRPQKPKRRRAKLAKR
jgi:DNA-binding NarL/FixJ family response regulator